MAVKPEASADERIPLVGLWRRAQLIAV